MDEADAIETDSVSLPRLFSFARISFFLVLLMRIVCLFLTGQLHTHLAVADVRLWLQSGHLYTRLHIVGDQCEWQ